MLNPEFADLDKSGKYIKLGFTDSEGDLATTIELRKSDARRLGKMLLESTGKK